MFLIQLLFSPQRGSQLSVPRMSSSHSDYFSIGSDIKTDNDIAEDQLKLNGNSPAENVPLSNTCMNNNAVKQKLSSSDNNARQIKYVSSAPDSRSLCNDDLTSNNGCDLDIVDYEYTIKDNVDKKLPDDIIHMNIDRESPVPSLNCEERNNIMASRNVQSPLQLDNVSLDLANTELYDSKHILKNNNENDSDPSQTTNLFRVHQRNKNQQLSVDNPLSFSEYSDSHKLGAKTTPSLLQVPVNYNYNPSSQLSANSETVSQNDSIFGRSKKNQAVLEKDLLNPSEIENKVTSPKSISENRLTSLRDTSSVQSVSLDDDLELKDLNSRIKSFSDVMDHANKNVIPNVTNTYSPPSSDNISTRLLSSSLENIQIPSSKSNDNNFGRNDATSFHNFLSRSCAADLLPVTKFSKVSEFSRQLRKNVQSSKNAVGPIKMHRKYEAVNDCKITAQNAMDQDLFKKSANDIIKSIKANNMPACDVGYKDVKRKMYKDHINLLSFKESQKMKRVVSQEHVSLNLSDKSVITRQKMTSDICNSPKSYMNNHLSTKLSSRSKTSSNSLGSLMDKNSQIPSLQLCNLDESSSIKSQRLRSSRKSERISSSSEVINSRDEDDTNIHPTSLSITSVDHNSIDLNHEPGKFIGKKIDINRSTSIIPSNDDSRLTSPTIGSNFSTPSYNNRRHVDNAKFQLKSPSVPKKTVLSAQVENPSAISPRITNLNRSISRCRSMGTLSDSSFNHLNAGQVSNDELPVKTSTSRVEQSNINDEVSSPI